MPQSFSGIHVHLVFSTRDREPYLDSHALRSETHAYLGGISKNLRCDPLIVGGVADHIHLLARLGRTITVADWVKELKRSSSVWAKTKGVPTFPWQAGYGAFSVGIEQIPTLKAYISRQEEHHHRSSFQDEFRQILREHGLEWDEQYVWD